MTHDSFPTPTPPYPASSTAVPSAATHFDRPRLFLPTALFLSTVFTTVLAGYLLHVNFAANGGAETVNRIRGLWTNPWDLANGLPFCGTILLILMAHEMGHYLACRHYGIRCTLPYVIPAPPPFNPFGTFGAVIKIKSPFYDRRQLFDVGIAGPLAGFAFILPALLVGLLHSKEFVVDPSVEQILEFGEPVLFQAAAQAFFEGEAALISLHPIGWAAWFGMLATSINLLPIGQLDGGHMVYALFGQRGHRLISYLTFAGLIGVSFFSWPMLGYLVFALILLFLGFRHPRPYANSTPLGRGRRALALLGLIIFLLTFIPVPVQLVDSLGL